MPGSQKCMRSRSKGSYDLDVSSLERAYRTLQSRLHPDKYAMKSQVAPCEGCSMCMVLKVMVRSCMIRAYICAGGAKLLC